MSSPSLYDPFLGSHQGEKEFDDFKRTATANREDPAATANSSSLHSITEPAPIPNIMDLRDPADEEVGSSEDVTDDRAETVVRLVVSDFEQISEDEANTDNADDGQVQESLTNHHLLSKSVTRPHKLATNSQLQPQLKVTKTVMLSLQVNTTKQRPNLMSLTWCPSPRRSIPLP
jgi:hypothetical protein